MSTISNINAYEELSLFIEENLSKLTKLKLITRNKYEKLDQAINDYLIADNFGDNERKEMYAEEIETLYSEILDKTDKQLVADADPMVFALSKKLLACSEYEDYVPLLDKMSPEKAPEELLGDLTDVLLKMAEDMKGAPLTSEERDRLTQRIADGELLKEEEKTYADSHYEYSHPDYTMYAKQIRLSKPMTYLVPGFDVGEEDTDDTYESIVAQVEGWPREKLVKNITKVIYMHLEEWQKGEDGEDAYMYGLRVPLALIEHFHLHECLPAVMEVLRQDYEFHDVYFMADTLEDMLPAVLAHIIEADDLPVLMDFMHQPGLLFECKRFVARAVAHLPKLDKAMLQPVQQWLGEVLNYYFPMGPDTDVFDEITLDTLVYCCIHCNAVDLKPLIIKLYAKYRIPNIWVGGGCNEMRQQIKKAPLGTLAEESGEELLIDDLNAALEDEDDEDWEDEDFGDEDWEDEAGDPDFNIEEYDWQEFSPYAMRPKAVYKPIRTIQKYTLRVSLDGTKPAVWRELVVPSNLTLLSMASVILLAMGWDEDHLHQFIVGKGRNATCYATSIGELESGMLSSKDGRKFCIGELLRKQGDVTLFEYDYGDSWYHSVQLMSIEEYAQNEKKEILLTAGERACPPEDCGGIPGYMDICEAMKHPDTAYAQERIEWMGCRFDPDLFPLKKAQAIVKKCNQ